MSEIAQQIANSAVAQPTTEAQPNGSDRVRMDGKREYEPAKDDSNKIDFSSRFAALSKREKEILAKSRAIKEKESYINEYESAQKLAKENPVKLMEKFGLTYDQLTNFILDAKDSEDNSLEKKVSDLEARLEKDRLAKEELEREAAEAADQQIIEAYKSQIKSHVDANPDACEMIRLTDNYDLVFEVAHEHYDQTGQILKAEDAIKAVEDYLTKEAEEKILKAKKFAKSADAKHVDNTGELQEKWVAKEKPTLTNQLASDGGSPVNPNVPNWVDDEESKRRAAAFLAAYMKK
jgi:hypothetical protein